MTPQKRNADAVSPAGSSTESPHKRARSDSGADTTHDQNGVRSTANGDPDLVPDPSSKSHTTLDNDDQAALLTDLPRTWDEASDMDKLLMRMKEGSKASWINFGRQWERATGEKPAEGELQSRYKHLKNIKAQSSDLVGRQTEHEPLEELLNHSDDNTTLKTRKARRSSYAKSRPSDESSRAISQDSKALRVDAASISEDIFGHDLPESWEQANAGDQLIMRMKTSRKSWAVIEKAWQDLTGMTPVEGAVQERYRSLRGLVIPPRSKSAITKTHSVKAPDQAIAKSTQKAPKKRKSEVKISEEVSGESSSELSDQDSEDFAEDTATMACRKPRNGIKETAKTSSATKSSDQRTAKRTKLTHAEPSDAEVEAGWSSDEVLESSLAGSKSAQSSRTKSGMTVDSGTQNTAETAEEMLVEMKERGCSWTEIIQAWAEQTGTTYAEGTLRNRYTSIKKRMGIELSKTSASNKRKSGATCQDGDENESCRKRSKTMAETPHATETPVKQNTDRGKRKSGVKYAESTTDEDELFATPAKPTKPAVAASSVKRGANRAVKVDRSDPEWLVTNEKSPLTSEDLHAEFSNPKTYEQFTKSDWEDLRETLPPNVPLNPDGYSIPMTFFKYDPDFRRGIREFQEDLAAGRLDPKWQAEAAEAMEARARGDFDAYKEEQFEAFWGQKQKMPHGALAGESTKIKLDLLIENEIFKVGDSFSYTRVFGRGKSGILIEKDCKIVGIDGKALEFAIPPGQRKFSRRMFESAKSGNPKAEAKAPIVNGGTPSDDGNVQDVAPSPVNETNGNGVTEAMNPEQVHVEANNKPLEDETHEPTASEVNTPIGASALTNGHHPSTPSHQELHEDIIHSISNLSELEHKIIDVDGRLNSKEVPVANTWKHFRGIRNNQDLGSLFEMREDFYVYKHPRIVKEAKRKR